jgi:hypothetical protein
LISWGYIIRGCQGGGEKIFLSKKSGVGKENFDFEWGFYLGLKDRASSAYVSRRPRPVIAQTGNGFCR